MMKDVRLVRLDPLIEKSLTSGPAYMDAMVREDWHQVAALVHRLTGRKLTLTPVSVDVLEWDGYFVVDAVTHEVVGSSGFKGPPDEDGVVEIAYFTYPDFEGKGYATSMVRKLIDMATGSEMVERVVAHTLPCANASTRVLEKVGLTFVGEVDVPDDGNVWRWQMQRRQ